MLPITPSGYSETAEQDVKIFETVEGGEIAVVGKQKLKQLTFSSFFPAREYPFAVVDEFIPPSDLKTKIEKWRDSKEPIRVLIPSSGINHMFAIKTLSCSEKDPTGDIYYDMDLVEYKELNVPAAKNKAPIHPTTNLRIRPLSPHAGGTSSKKNSVTHQAMSVATKVETNSEKSLWGETVKAFKENETVKAVVDTSKKIINAVFPVTKVLDSRGFNVGEKVVDVLKFLKKKNPRRYEGGDSGGGSGSF